MARVFAMLLVLALPQAEAMAAPKQIQVTWGELAPLVTGRKIAAVLRDGALVEGKVREVTADGLALETKGGQRPVARQMLSTLRVRRSGYKWKTIGAGIGLGAGLALALPLRAYANNEGANWDGIVAAAVAVPTALGLFAGYGADRKTIEIAIRPER